MPTSTYTNSFAMKLVILPLSRIRRRIRSNCFLTVCSSFVGALLYLGQPTVQAQTCTPAAGLAHWNFDNANDEEIDNSSGIPSSSGGGCIGKVLKRTDGGSNSTYNNTVGNADSDYGPVCASKKSICTNSWDKSTAFERYVSLTISYPKGVAGKLSGLTFCELALARTKSGGDFITNDRPESYQVRLRKRVNGGSWSVVWTGSVKSTTKKDWTGTSSNPVPPSSWGTYNSSSDGFTLQTTDGTTNVDFEFQISAFQTSDTNAKKEVWDLDEIDVAGCCDATVCSPFSKLVEWNFDNASDNQIDNSSGISATGGSYSSCAKVLFNRTDGGSNSVYNNDPTSGDKGPVCSSNQSICTGTWDKATPFERFITVKVTFPAGKAGKLYGLSFCEMAMNKTKSGGGFNTSNQPEYYKVRLKKNGTVIWTGSVHSTTKTTWSSSTSAPPSDWGNYNSNTDGFPTQTTDGSSTVAFEFEITAYQSSDSGSSQEIWDLDEVAVFGCCDDACVTPAKPVAVDVPRCGPGTVNLTATGCATGTLYWYATSTSTAVLGTGTFFTTPSLTASEDYYVSCVEGLCESGRDPVRAIINAIPAKPTAVNGGASRCGPGTVTLTATGCTGTLNWYLQPTGGASLGTGSSFTTPSLATTTTYYVNCVASTSCQSSRAAAVATIQTCDCDISITATRGDCDAATNQYTVTGVISLTNTAGGTATITDGSVTTTVTIAAGATSVPYTLTGLNSNGAVHTISINLPNCGTDAKTYTAPAECKKICPTGNCFPTRILKN